MTSTEKPASAEKTTAAFTADERAAMKERADEVKAAKRSKGKADDAAAVLAKIEEMEDSDRDLAGRLHVLITSAAPELSPKLWYGMPAYAKDGKIVCFFQGAQKFKTRYATLGFSDEARLDDGTLWATSFALAELTDADEERIGALIRRAVG